MKKAKSQNAEKQQRSSKHRAEWLAKFRFRPGESGNPGGRPKNQSITAELRALMAKGTTARDVAAAIVAGVVERHDPAFARILMDRCDGTLQQVIQNQISGTITTPAATGQVCIIQIPSNGRETYPTPALDTVGVPVALPAPTPTPKAVVSATLGEPEPEPVPVTAPADPNDAADPASPAYVPRCFRPGAKY